MSKIDKIRTHISENKVAYIAGVAGVGVGAVLVGGMFYGRQIIINDSLNVSVNSPKTNIVVANLTRRGHPGNIIRCVETGEVFASQRRAAEALGLNRIDIYKMLKGELDNVKGLSFENLGEAS